MNNKTTNVRYLAQLALLAAIEVVMKLMGLGSVPVGPLYMSFLTVPIAVGAMTMGPTAGAILAACSVWSASKDAITGASVIDRCIFPDQPDQHLRAVRCHARADAGASACCSACCVAWTAKKSWRLISSVRMSAPLLNTIFFMGYIVLVFYKTDFVQERVASLGVANPLSFVVALVGVQGLIEIIVGCAVGGVLARAVASFLGHRAPAKAE